MVETLQTLYGSAAAEVAPQVRELIERWRHRLPAVPAAKGRTRLSERDVLLITYADQVREPGNAPLSTLGAFARRRLRGLVSGIHLLPFYPWSSDDGFSVKDYRAVDPAYGTWDDIAALGADFDLMFDAVLNHASAQGEWFQKFLADDPRYRDFFVTVTGHPDLSAVIRPRTLPLITEFPATGGVRRVWTTFSADQVDLNFKNPAVLLEALDVLLFYVARGARFIRLDAIAFLWKEVGTACLHLPQTHAVIRLMRTVLDEFAPDVQLITETNVPHADNLTYFGDGTNEAQLVYNFALPPLVLHSLQTGNAETLTRWAQALVLPSDRVTFFNFLASHDGIGLNPARGILTDSEIDAMARRTLDHGGAISYKAMPDGTQVPYELNINYLDALSHPAEAEPGTLAARKFLVSQAIMLCLQGVPGIYFHSLVGSRGDPAAAQATGIKRRINREKLNRSSLERDLDKPGTLRAAVFTGYAELLRRRRTNTAFAPHAQQAILELDPRVFAVWRADPQGSTETLCLHNVSPETVELSVEEPVRGRWRLEPFGVEWVASAAGLPGPKRP